MIFGFPMCWSALGELEGSSKILDAIVEIGEGFELTTLDFDPDVHYYEFFEAGAMFGFKSKVLSHVMFHLKETVGYSRCRESVINGVSGLTKLEQLIQMFGAPLECGAGWVKYAVGLNKSVHFEFKDDGLDAISFLLLESSRKF